MTEKALALSTQLHRLAEALERFDPRRDAIATGGVIIEAAPSFYRVAGLGRSVSVGERVQGGLRLQMQGEVIHVDEAGALIKPYRSDAPLALGGEVFRCGAKMLAPCAQWRGRVINALGEPIDGAGPIPQGARFMPLDQPAPPPLQRQRIERPMHTGVRAIDIFTPLCFGQRIGVFAGSGVGKSTLLAMLANAKGFDDLVIGLIGERGREVREFLESTLGERQRDAVTIVSTGDESALMRRLAASSAISVAEYFRDEGRNVLLILDSVTRFAQASREVGIAAGEPAVARGFPPSVFSDLPRLLERAGPGVDGAGSITGIFSVLIDGDDHNDPIADSIRGILDGHIVLDRAIADLGRYPAINILASLSRMSQLVWSPDRRAFALKLRSMTARFEETRDLRAMGGYQPGLDAELDLCIAMVPKIYACLCQSTGDAPSEDAFRDMANALHMASDPGASS